MSHLRHCLIEENRHRAERPGIEQSLGGETEVLFTVGSFHERYGIDNRDKAERPGKKGVKVSVDFSAPSAASKPAETIIIVGANCCAIGRMT